MYWSNLYFFLFIMAHTLDLFVKLHDCTTYITLSVSKVPDNTLMLSRLMTRPLQDLRNC